MGGVRGSETKQLQRFCVGRGGRDAASSLLGVSACGELLKDKLTFPCILNSIRNLLSAKQCNNFTSSANRSSH